MVFPVFRGYTQQDAQEFLRCFMDQLHEELKETMPESADSDNELGCVSESNNRDPNNDEADNEDYDKNEHQEEDSSQSEAEFETCDSGLSSEKSSYSGKS